MEAKVLLWYGSQCLRAYKQLTASYFDKIFENSFQYGSYLCICVVGNTLTNSKYKKQRATQEV